MAEIYKDPYELIADTSNHPELCLKGLSEILDFDYEKKMDFFLGNHYEKIRNYSGDLNKESIRRFRTESLHETLIPMSERIQSIYRELENEPVESLSLNLINKNPL